MKLYNIESAPSDGSFFICWKGKEAMILNKPKGCALGKWKKHKGEWYGSFENFDPTHWQPLFNLSKKSLSFS